MFSIYDQLPHSMAAHQEQVGRILLVFLSIIRFSVVETSSHSSLFEGASAPPYELIKNGSIDEKQSSGKTGR